jgi:phosphoadenosine phosphosulfate reductase
MEDFAVLPEGTAQELSAAFPRLNLAQRIAMIRREINGRIVFTTSFGMEDQVIADAIFTQNLDVEVITLDTGRLFPETYNLWSRTEHHYATRVSALHPDAAALDALIARHGVNGFKHSIEARNTCCAVRKVEPLGRALADAAAWITGLRADQSRIRATAAFAAIEPRYRLMKLNPLLDWTRERVAAHVRDHDIPINPLHSQGFASIGCAPCTRAVAPGEPERAGRWWWEHEGKKECGLHPDHPPHHAEGSVP